MNISLLDDESLLKEIISKTGETSPCISRKLVKGKNNTEHGLSGKHKLIGISRNTVNLHTNEYKSSS